MDQMDYRQYVYHAYSALIPRFTGGISGISSSVTVYLILRSMTKLTSTYHRLLFGMSIADIMASIAMALTSLPMPSYMTIEEEEGFSWAGSRIGNTLTCEIQGFFFYFGMGMSLNYYGSLCIYYACSIAFGMQERKIVKRVEPFLHIIPIALGLVIGVPPLFLQLLNPNPASPVCSGTEYPPDCTTNPDKLNDPDKPSWVVECIRGSPELVEVQDRHTFIIFTLVFTTVLVSMVLIIRKLVLNDRDLKTYEQHLNQGALNFTTQTHERSQTRQREIRVIWIQGLAYVGVLIFTLVPCSIGMNPDRTELMYILLLITFPLQGFCNLFVFLGHKIYNQKRASPNQPLKQILHTLFFTEFEEPAIMESMLLVEDTAEAKDTEEIEDISRPCENMNRNGLTDNLRLPLGSPDTTSAVFNKFIDNTITANFQKIDDNSRTNSGGNDVMMDNETRGGLSGFSDLSGGNDVMMDDETRGGLSGFSDLKSEMTSSIKFPDSGSNFHKRR